MLIVENGGPISPQELAGLTQCSSRQLAREFSETLGVTPREFGQLVRLNNSRQLLRVNATVTDAMYTAGYGSVRAFYERAATKLGMTPRNTRKVHPITPSSGHVRTRRLERCSRSPHHVDSVRCESVPKNSYFQNSGANFTRRSWYKTTKPCQTL